MIIRSEIYHLRMPKTGCGFFESQNKEELAGLFLISLYKNTNSRREKSFKTVFGKITMISVAASSQLISEVCLCPRFSGEETGELDIHT